MDVDYVSQTLNQAKQRYHIPEGMTHDNTGIESFHAKLKKEEVYTTAYSDFKEENRALFNYVEGFYNCNRIQRSVD